MDAIKNTYFRLEAHFGWFITVIISLSIMSYLLGIIIEPEAPVTNGLIAIQVSLLDKFLYNLQYYFSPLLKMIGSAGVTAAIFQVIIKSTAFMNVLKDTLDVDKRNWSKYSDNKIKDILKSIKDAKSFVSVSYIDEKQASVKLAKKVFLKKIKDIKKMKVGDRTESDLHLLEKNYIVDESRITKTIAKNGSEISTFELDIRFISKGAFSFMMKNWTEGKDEEYPPFSEFKESEYNKRFCEFSFFASYFNLIKNNKHIDKHRYAKLKTTHTDREDKKGFTLVLRIDDQFEENDTLTLSFSTTIKDAYSAENLSRIESGEDPKPYSTTKAPVGVRVITIQEEIYGDDGINPKIRPTLSIDSNQMEPSSVSQSIFYNKYKWTIYYKDYHYDKIEYSVV